MAPPDTLERDSAVMAAPALDGTRDTETRLTIAPRRRGRPLLVSRDQVLEQIRSIATQGSLFRVHFDAPALYARARRLWGSWESAVRAAGVDYDATMSTARRRSIEGRRRPR